MPSDAAPSYSQLVCGRLIRFVLPDVGELDPRSITILNRKRVLKEQREVRSHFDPDHLLPGAHRDPWYPDGPLVVELEERDDDTLHGTVAHIADLIFDWDANLRAHIVGYATALVEKQIMLPHTAAIVSQCGPLLSGREEGDWEAAALRTSSVLHNDFLLAVAGLRQSIRLRHKPTYNESVVWLLSPPLEGVEAIELDVWSPRESAENCQRVISECEGAPSLDDLLDTYFERLGHLPLGSLSAGAAVERWAKTHSLPDECWATIVAWAQKRCSPLAVYHAAEIGLRCWQQVAPKPESMRELVTQVVGSSSASFDTPPGNSAWRVLNGLAAHYCRHLELLVPGHQGDRIAALALWMARHVAESFGIGDDKGFADLWAAFAGTIEQARFVWLFGGQVPNSSLLRYSLHFSASPWSDGLTEVLASCPDEVLDEVLTPEVSESLVAPLIRKQALLTPPHNPDADTDYSFGQGVADAVAAVQERLTNDDLREELDAARELYTRVSDTAELLEAIEKLWDADRPSQLFLGYALREAASVGRLSTDQLWSAIESEDWLLRVLSECELEAVESVTLSTVHVSLASRSDRVVLLAHGLAEAASSSTVTDRRSALFVLTALVCLAGETSSAVERLLQPETAELFADDAAELKGKLLDMLGVAPSWMRGRLRALAAIL